MTDFESDKDFIRSILSASDDCIKIIGLDGKLLYMSGGGQRVMEIDDFEQFKGCPWPDFWEGADRISAEEAVQSAAKGNSVRFEGFANTAKGSPRFWEVRVSPIRDEIGHVKSLLSVSHDITHLKEAQNQLMILSQEARHRLKNILAIVQAIANQTVRSTRSAEETKTALIERYGALGRAHDMLTQGTWSQAAITDIVQSSIKSHDAGQRIDVRGPDIDISAKRALGLSLALHELTTNALKYGALKSEAGSVRISWSVDGDCFTFEWNEVGGPRPSAPTRTGFGSQIINRILPAYFNGSAATDYADTGLKFSLVAPATELLVDH